MVLDSPLTNAAAATANQAPAPAGPVFARLLAAVLCLTLSVACDNDTPTTPTDTTTTTTATTVAEPTTSETFSGTLPVAQAKFFSFTTTTYGRIDITLTTVGGTFVPSTVMVGVGLGQPSGIECVTTTSVNTAAGSTAQVTGVFAAGVYCARVADIGNLFAPASFSITIAYP